MLAKCNFHAVRGLADRPDLIMCDLHGGVYVHIVDDGISCLGPSGGQRPKGAEGSTCNIVLLRLRQDKIAYSMQKCMQWLCSVTA